MVVQWSCLGARRCYCFLLVFVTLLLYLDCSYEQVWHIEDDDTAMRGAPWMADSTRLAMEALCTPKSEVLA
jgi:hypothetical protein